jgi:hypothetical protein
VAYPAAGPLGRWPMLARVVSQTVTVAIVKRDSYALVHTSIYLIRDGSDG